MDLLQIAEQFIRLNENQTDLIDINDPSEKLEYETVKKIYDLLKKSQPKMVSDVADNTFESILKKLEDLLKKYAYNTDFIRSTIRRFKGGLGNEIDSVSYFIYELFGEIDLMTADEHSNIRTNITDLIKNMVESSEAITHEDIIKALKFKRIQEIFKSNIQQIIKVRNQTYNQRGVGNGEVLLYLLCAISNEITFEHPKGGSNGDIIIDGNMFDVKSFISFGKENYQKNVILSPKVTYTIMKHDSTASKKDSFSGIKIKGLSFSNNTEDCIDLEINVGNKDFIIENIPYDFDLVFDYRGENVKSVKNIFKQLNNNDKSKSQYYHRFLMQSTNKSVTDDDRAKILQIILDNILNKKEIIFLENFNDGFVFRPIKSINYITDNYRCLFNDSTNNLKIIPK